MTYFFNYFYICDRNIYMGYLENGGPPHMPKKFFYVILLISRKELELNNVPDKYRLYDS